MLVAAVALLIPLFGNMYVDGWNWGLGDFIFAWVFFVILSLTTKFVMSKISNRTYRTIAGIAIVAVFAFIWIKLATG
ncbi:hypothetical protein KW800_02410 [Candidatus Parcubacteria bacterium]|nr:hypothetical protein [Candidatus Parcubacteria bacterium]